jgi:serine protease
MSRRRLAGLTIAVAAAVATGAVPVVAATSSPNDPYFTSAYQWGLTGATASIHAPAAWCASTGAGVLVGDVDTGADFGHPDLAGKLVAGARFTSGDGSQTGSGQASVSDDFGHGSMTTGLITAVTNNGIGIAAVAPDSRVLVVKVLMSNGSGSATGSDADVAAGIRYAADHGARVINLSIGPEIPLTGTTSSIPSAISDAAAKGVLVVVAAGNSSLPAASYTGIQGVALVVGALGPDGLPAYYSNSLAGVNLYAPGGNSAEGNDAQHLIISTNPFGQITGNGRYDLEQGTSFAAPHAAGVAALLMARGMTAQAAHDRLISTAASRNGLPELDAASALGVSPDLRCAPGSAGPGGTQGGGGSSAGGQGGATTASGPGSRAPAPIVTGSPIPATPSAGATGASAASSASPGSGHVTAGNGGGGASTIGSVPHTEAWPPLAVLVAVAVLLVGGLAWRSMLVRRRRRRRLSH